MHGRSYLDRRLAPSRRLRQDEEITFAQNLTRFDQSFDGKVDDLAQLRAHDLAALAPTATTANVLTILSIAALGLGVDVRVVARAGVRVTGAVVASLLVLGAVSLALIHGLGVL